MDTYLFWQRPLNMTTKLYQTWSSVANYSSPPLTSHLPTYLPLSPLLSPPLISSHLPTNLTISPSFSPLPLTSHLPLSLLTSSFHHALLPLPIVEDSCKWCCKKDSQSKCQPLKSLKDKILPHGTPCLVGYCDPQVCFLEKDKSALLVHYSTNLI